MNKSLLIPLGLQYVYTYKNKKNLNLSLNLIERLGGTPLHLTFNIRITELLKFIA